MATIPGSHFDATAAQPVNVVETTTGSGLPSPVAGDFNLEIFVGSRFSSSAPTQPAPGYDGLAILAPSGAELDLITGAYAVTDFGGGFDTLSAYGDNETITGPAPRITMNVYGSQDTANVGDQDTLSIFGTNDTTNVTGDSQVFDHTDHQTMTAGTGTHFFKLANFVSLTLDSGSDQVYTAENDTIIGGTGNDTVNLIGQHNLYIGGTNAASSSFIWDGGNNVFNDTIIGGAGTVTIVAHTAGDSITAGSGNDTVYAFTDDDTIAGGSGNMLVSGLGADDSITGGTNPAGTDVILLIDGTNGGHNTVTGGAGSDTINVSGPDNLIRAGTGADLITIIGTNDTVTSGVAGGENQDQIDLSGSTTALLVDGPNAYSDTVAGFSQADGDRIHLTTDTVADALAHSMQVNGGQDTLIMLSDTSTILLKGVSTIDTSFFS